MNKDTPMTIMDWLYLLSAPAAGVLIVYLLVRS